MQSRDVAITIGVILAVVLLFSLVGGGMMGFGGMWPGMMGGYYGPGYGLWGGVLMMLFWVLIIGGIVLLVAWLARQGGPTPLAGPGQESTALEILKRRYARGDITKEQFEQMRHDLE